MMLNGLFIIFCVTVKLAISEFFQFGIIYKSIPHFICRKHAPFYF